MKKLLSLQFRSLRDYRQVIGAFVIMLSLALTMFVQPASAKVIIQEKGTLIIPSTEVIDDDLFVAAENVIIEGKITGDVYVGTGNLTLTGATIGDSLVVGAGSVSIDKDSKIGGSLIAGSGDLKNYAPVGRNVMVGAGAVVLDSKIGKEARVGGGEITLGSNTKIAGNFTYVLPEDENTLTQDPQTTVGGTTSRYTPPVNQGEMAKSKEDMRKFGMVASRGWMLISFVGSLLVGFLLLKLFPKTSLGLANQIKSDLLRNLGMGFLIIVLTVPVLLVLTLTIIGLPLAGMLILVLCIALHLAKLAASYALGRFLATQFNWNKMGVYMTAFIGLAVFYLLRGLPGFGWIVSILFTWAGLGATMIYIRSNLKNL